MDKSAIDWPKAMKVYSDMSVEACAKRFDARREHILRNIREGKVSASMSGIEYFPAEFAKLGSIEDWAAVQAAMTWNGEAYAPRPEWKREYQEFVARALSDEGER